MFKGLYIHIPFCGNKCPYCDFFSVVGNYNYEVYFKALLEELKLYSYYGFSFKTIYFGGGTPSVIPPKIYEKFFKELSNLVNLSDIEEITLEVNPENYNLLDFLALKEVGFNRISVGVQSFLEKNLKILGRRHGVKNSLKTLENAYKAGFENILVDIIWGLPGQEIGDLKREFQFLKELPVVHLSAYMLTIYEDTPLKTLVERELFKLPGEEVIEKLYYTLLEEANKLDFERYEISNFAKDKRYFSKHNLLYWKMEPFLGLGSGAWSFDGRNRWSNVKNVEAYINAVLEGEKPVAYSYELSGEEFLKESIITGLRTVEGIPYDWVKEKLSKELIDNFFTLKGNRIAFNDRGFLLSNTLLSLLV